jgi:replicative superfamily II helicase
MIGRAGRYGFDKEADSVLCCYPNERARAVELMTRRLERVESCLTSRQRGLSRVILEAIGIGLVLDQRDLKDYLRCTLLYTQHKCKHDSTYRKSPTPHAVGADLDAYSLDRYPIDREEEEMDHAAWVEV